TPLRWRSETRKRARHPAKSGHSLRCGDRKNRSTPAPRSIDMHDRVRTRARRQIPAVGRILDALGHCDLPRPVIVDLVRRKLSEIRAQSPVPEFESIMVLIRRSLDELHAGKLQPIVNGTGIVIHTNFGRAPLPRAATSALSAIGSGYSNLEYDLAAGERGGRSSYVEISLALLCRAEAATVVNNCAAALVL